MVSTMADYATLAAIREVEGGFEADTLVAWMGTISGAQLLFQQIVLAEQVAAGKRVLSLQTIFANGGRSGEPVSIDVDPMQAGRSFSSLELTVRQQGTVISRALALMTADEEDFLRHQSPAPGVTTWTDWPDREPGFWPGRIRQSPTSTPDAVSVRVDLDGENADQTVGRGLVAVASEQEVLGALGRLARGADPAGPGVSGTVLTHRVDFLEATLAQGLVLNVMPSYAGRGRASGFGQVVDDDGHLLATFSTTGLMRRRKS